MPPEVLATIAGANSAAALAKNSKSLAKSARTRLRRIGTYDPAWINLADIGGPQQTCTIPQLRSMESFLATREAQAVLALLAVNAAFPLPERSEEVPEGETVESVERTSAILQGLFETEAKKFNSSLDKSANWRPHIASLWSSVDLFYRGELAIPGYQKFDADSIDEFSLFAQSPIQTALSSTSLQSPTSPQKILVRRVIDLASDIGRVHKAITLADRVASAMLALPHAPIGSHTDMATNANFDGLYISRTLRLEQRRSDNQVNDLLHPVGAPYRAILRGNPGAGKSTFVEYLSKEAVKNDGVPVLIVTCREYFKSGWSNSIVTHVCQQIAREHSINVDHQSIEDFFLLGRACLVFDGLDEITATSQRIEMAGRIQSLGQQYPGISILVTTREVGYEAAPLSASVYTNIQLDEFTSAQVTEYARKWFDIVGKGDLAEGFLTDSSNLDDLRKNPLLLSLLCALYREHGTLPTKRRQVYSDCAQLMFRRWDDQRHIESDGSMPEYADFLMQEIARWFHDSPMVRDGIPETQLRRVLAQWLESRAGFDVVQAEKSAASFLKFCGGRAWLLSSFGSENNEKVFQFSHKTFYEFFAAEAIARQVEDDFAAAKAIKLAYANDQSSVIPELIIQAYDFRNVGASSVFKMLARDAVPVGLLFRLMDGTLLPSQSRVLAFEHTIKQWSTNRLTSADKLAVLRMNIPARNHFIASYLDPQSPSEFQGVFVDYWLATNEQFTLSPREAVWGDCVDSLLIDWSTNQVSSPSALVATLALEKGLDLTFDWSPESLIAASSLSGTSTTGPALRTALAVLGGEAHPDGESLPESLRSASEILDRDVGLNQSALLDICDLYRFRLPVAKEHGSSSTVYLCENIVTLFACACFEAGVRETELVDFTDRYWGRPLTALMRLRMSSTTSDELGFVYANGELAEEELSEEYSAGEIEGLHQFFVDKLGDWFARWMNLSRPLLAYE